MHVATLTVELHLPDCTSLKQKRSRLKPLLAQLHRAFNVSAAEVGDNDHHRSAVIAVAVVSNDARHAQRLLSRIPAWIESRRPDIQVVDHQLEIV
jgi:uncharacterized protein YlxP (DUF503 family)